MAHTSSWLSKFAKLYIQYCCASLACIPAGLLAFGLIRSGLRESISLALAIMAGLLIATAIWRILDQHLLREVKAVIPAGISVISSNWQFQSVGGSACLAGTMAMVTIVVPPTPIVEYKSYETTCRTGSATRIYPLSREE